MRMCRLGFFVVAAVLHSGPGRGQALEVGGIVGTACRGIGGSTLCGGGAHVLSGVYLSLMVDDRVEIGVQNARLGGRSLEYSIGRDDNQYNRQAFDMVPNAPARIDLAFVDRSRTFLVSRFLYYFLRGERVRPIVGAEVGELVDTKNFVCQPSGCERLVPLLVGSHVGLERSRHLDLGFMAGASIRATNRVRLRFGIQLHDFTFEDLSTSAWFVEIGFRFGPK
jgi:hypothetical protein